MSHMDTTRVRIIDPNRTIFLTSRAFRGRSPPKHRKQCIAHRNQRWRLLESAALGRYNLVTYGISADYGLITYDVSADGQQFVIEGQVEESSNTISVTQNWLEEFRDRRPD